MPHTLEIKNSLHNAIFTFAEAVYFHDGDVHALLKGFEELHSLTPINFAELLQLTNTSYLYTFKFVDGRMWHQEIFVGQNLQGGKAFSSTFNVTHIWKDTETLLHRPPRVVVSTLISRGCSFFRVEFI